MLVWAQVPLPERVLEPELVQARVPEPEPEPEQGLARVPELVLVLAQPVSASVPVQEQVSVPEPVREQAWVPGQGPPVRVVLVVRPPASVASRQPVFAVRPDSGFSVQAASADWLHSFPVRQHARWLP